MLVLRGNPLLDLRIVGSFEPPVVVHHASAVVLGREGFLLGHRGLGGGGEQRCCESESGHETLLEGRGFNEAATARATARGLSRSDWTVSLFLSPWITIAFPFFIARYPSAATCFGSATPNRNSKERELPATPANSVAVAPGQLTVADTPVPRSSYQSASVKEFTNALLA